VHACSILLKNLDRVHTLFCRRHDDIVQSIKSTQSTLDALIRESRNFTVFMQDVASTHLEVLDPFTVLDPSCIADLEERLLCIQPAKKLGAKANNALNDLLGTEQSLRAYRYACKEMLEAIPVTDDAMERWIMYLEIQAQQQCEEQFSGLKSMLSSYAPSLDDFTCAICLSIYHDPTKLTNCSHTFCRSCLDQCAPLTQSWAPDRPRACPLCRTPFLLSQCSDDSAIAWSLKTFFPKELKKKQKEYSKERVRERWQRFLRGTVYTSSDDTLYTITGSVIIAWHENPDSVYSDQMARAEIMSFVAWPF
jgi:hypothetical protein